MRNKHLSTRQMICLVVLFLFGNSVMFGVNGSAGRDSWLALLLAFFGALIVTAMYARIVYLNQDTDFFDSLTSLFGRFFGFILTVLFMWYALHLCALLMRCLLEFGMLNSLQNPPHYIILFLFTVTGIYLVKSGESVLGRWSVIIFALVLVVYSVICVISTRDMNLLNILPVLRRKPAEILNASVRYLSFPYLETVMFLPVIQGKVKEAGKIYRYGLLWTTLILMAVLLCNLLLLGEPMLERLYFPSHSAAKLINLGKIFTRLEEIVSMFTLVSGVSKFAVCLIVLNKGFSHLCKNKSKGDFTMPLGILALAFSLIAANDIMDMDNFLAIYPYYAFIFQIGIPLILWVRLEYTHRKRKHAAVKTA